MTTRSLSLFFAGSIALALSALAGCSAQVSGGPGHHGDNISDDDSSSMTDDSCGGDFENPVNAIAIPLGTLEQFEDTGGDQGGSSSGGGGGISPDTIVIQVASSAAYQCTAPVLASCGPTQTWEVSFELAPSRVAPGTFDLSDASLNAFFSVSQGDGTGNCTGGGGSFVDGQLVIDAVDETAIHFHLAGTSGGDIADGVTVDGKYVANRCGF